MGASYNEAFDGDMSNNGLAPTALALDPGSNPVQGFFGISPVPDVADLDYLKVLVPNGHRLSGITLVSLSQGGANSFLGVQSGPQFTLPPTATDPTPLLGWSHIFKSQTGSNLLPALGFPGGLAAGSYTFWINETDKSEAWSYAFDFQTSAIPEPSVGVIVIVGLGLLAIGTSVRRKRSV